VPDHQGAPGADLPALPARCLLPVSPLWPRKVEADFLVRRVREQIARSKDVLPEAARAEYQEALRTFEGLARKAR